MTTLLEGVRRYAEVHADADGVAQTPIRGLTTAPSGLVYAISRPLVCLVVQGSPRESTVCAQPFCRCRAAVLKTLFVMFALRIMLRCSRVGCFPAGD
jgi:hypothetical protein